MIALVESPAGPDASHVAWSLLQCVAALSVSSVSLLWLVWFFSLFSHIALSWIKLGHSKSLVICSATLSQSPPVCHSDHSSISSSHSAPSLLQSTTDLSQPLPLPPHLSTPALLARTPGTPSNLRLREHYVTSLPKPSSAPLFLFLASPTSMPGVTCVLGHTTPIAPSTASYHISVACLITMLFHLWTP